MPIAGRGGGRTDVDAGDGCKVLCEGGTCAGGRTEVEPESGTVAGEGGRTDVDDAAAGGG
ncbi:Hypothetical protein A7982_09778 [Minicystis rosea]|nr:Hypothetical protein A7982_09778 [Minicystis rosea]